MSWQIKHQISRSDCDRARGHPRGVPDQHPVRRAARGADLPDVQRARRHSRREVLRPGRISLLRILHMSRVRFDFWLPNMGLVFITCPNFRTPYHALPILQGDVAGLGHGLVDSDWACSFILLGQQVSRNSQNKVSPTQV